MYNFSMVLTFKIQCFPIKVIKKTLDSMVSWPSKNAAAQRSQIQNAFMLPTFPPPLRGTYLLRIRLGPHSYTNLHTKKTRMKEDPPPPKKQQNQPNHPPALTERLTDRWMPLAITIPLPRDKHTRLVVLCWTWNNLR